MWCRKDGLSFAISQAYTHDTRSRNLYKEKQETSRPTCFLSQVFFSRTSFLHRMEGKKQLCSTKVYTTTCMKLYKKFAARSFGKFLVQVSWSCVRGIIDSHVRYHFHFYYMQVCLQLYKQQSYRRMFPILSSAMRRRKPVAGRQRVQLRRRWEGV